MDKIQINLKEAKRPIKRKFISFIAIISSIIWFIIKYNSHTLSLLNTIFIIYLFVAGLISFYDTRDILFNKLFGKPFIELTYEYLSIKLSPFTRRYNFNLKRVKLIKIELIKVEIIDIENKSFTIDLSPLEYPVVMEIRQLFSNLIVMLQLEKNKN